MRSVINRATSYLNRGKEDKKAAAAQAAAAERAELESQLSDWRASPLGSYFFARIKQDRYAVMQGIMKANPYEPEAVQSLQLKYEMLGKIEAYCASILREGKKKQ